MYHVETRVLNQAVKRNNERLPNHFRFQLSEEDLKEIESLHESRLSKANLKSQIVMSSSHGGRRFLPYAFTEQGVAMLSTVLKSKTAIAVSIQIMDAFVGMRKTLALHSGLLQRISSIERHQLEADQKFEQIFQALESTHQLPTQGVFFDGQVFDAYELASHIIRSAKKSIILIDNYIDETTLHHLAKKEFGVTVHLLSKNLNKTLLLDILKANEQYGGFEHQSFSSSHDRFLVIDNEFVFHLGASLKDLGKKWFAFSKMEKSSIGQLLNRIDLLKLMR